MSCGLDLLDQLIIGVEKVLWEMKPGEALTIRLYK